MSYPDIATSWESMREPLTKTETDMAVNGIVRGRKYNTKTTYKFKLIHELVTSADMQSVIDCYNSVGASSVSYTWKGDSVVYSCIFTTEPTVQPVYDGLYQVTTELIGRTP